MPQQFFPRPSPDIGMPPPGLPPVFPAPHDHPPRVRYLFYLCYHASVNCYKGAARVVEQFHFVGHAQQTFKVKVHARHQYSYISSGVITCVYFDFEGKSNKMNTLICSRQTSKQATQLLHGSVLHRQCSVIVDVRRVLSYMFEEGRRRCSQKIVVNVCRRSSQMFVGHRRRLSQTFVKDRHKCSQKVVADVRRTLSQMFREGRCRTKRGVVFSYRFSTKRTYSTNKYIFVYISSSFHRPKLLLQYE